MIVNTIKSIKRGGNVQASNGFSIDGYLLSRQDNIVHLNIQVKLADGVEERSFNNGDIVLSGLPKPLGEFITYAQPWCNWTTDYARCIPIRMRVDTSGNIAAHYPSENEKMFANSPVCIDIMYMTAE